MGALCTCNRNGNNNVIPIIMKGDILVPENNTGNNNRQEPDTNDIKNQESEINNDSINNNNNNENEENENEDNNENENDNEDLSKSNSKNIEDEEDDYREEIKEVSERAENMSNSEDIENNKKDDKELIEKFDNLMKTYANYITDTEFDEAINPEVNKIEEDLEPLNQNSDKIKDLIDKDKVIDRPPLKFLSNEFIYKGMWNMNGQKEGFGIIIDKEGNKYIGVWKEDKFNGYGIILKMKIIHILENLKILNLMEKEK